MPDIFHSTKCFDGIPIILSVYPLTILLQHSDIERDIMSDDMVRFIYIFQKIIDIAIDISILRHHRLTDSMDSLSEKVYIGGDVHILIYSNLLMKFFSIKCPIYGSKLKNLIRSRKSGSFRIDEKQ